MPAPPSFRITLRNIYKSSIRKHFAIKRVRMIESLIEDAGFGKDGSRIRLLEVGCAQGLDFMQFASENKFDLYGVDNRDFSDRLSRDFKFLCCDAENLEFEDNYFDIALSVGVFEHIKPIQKLDRITKEFSRVAKKYIAIVPSNGTWLEPHRVQFNWQKKPPGRKIDDDSLFYYSDEAWAQFDGFIGSKTFRYNYVPIFYNNLVITNIF